MSDPFDALHLPVVPIDPDPAFRARLRVRLERALDLPKGVRMSNLTLDDETANNTDGPIRHGDVGYVSLWVPDSDRAAAFFSRVLGWSYRPTEPGSTHQVEGQSLPHGVFGASSPSNLFLCFAVDDVDATVQRVRSAGGEAEVPVLQPYGLTSNCLDHEGTPFAVFQLAAGAGPRPALNGRSHGDISYITMEVRDSAATRAFYGAALGWRFSPGRVEDGWGVEDIAPMTGLHGGHEQATVVPMYRVDGIHAAVERVRAAGGSATDPESRPYGLSSECVDDQGTRFYLGQH
jgi:predicted enzyme related to lactoylglutathione lyase